MLNQDHDELIRLADVPRHPLLRRRGKLLSQAVVTRWTTHGVDGVRLESLKLGISRYTTDGAIRRFIDALNNDQPAELATAGR
jgi:hypothetical protein